MDNSSVFKFTTLRKASDVVSTAADLIVQPSTTLIADLVAINDGTVQTSAQKLASLNARLQTYINSAAFLKTKAAFVASQSQTGTVNYYNQLYDNIVARTITKSTNTPIYKLVVEQLKGEHVLSKAVIHPGMNKSKVKIVLPDSIIFSFVSSNPSTSGSTTTTDVNVATIADEYVRYTTAQELIAEARAENVLEFHPSGQVLVRNVAYSAINDVLGHASISVPDAQNIVSQRMAQLSVLDPKDSNVAQASMQFERIAQMVEEASSQNVATFDQAQMVEGGRYLPILQTLGKGVITVDAADKLVSKRLKELSKQVFQLVPAATYTLVGEQWVETSGLVSPTGSKPNVTDNAIMVYSHGCWLKFPFQIADLRVVEQQTVGYLPAEIAHINNTQPGELNTRVTRRLKRTEDLESLISEDEVSHETDTQSTEKFGFEKEASQVQTEESSWNVNASVSASYGPISASIDGGYESSTSSTNSNSASQSYAKEVVQKVVDRVTHKVKRERTTKTIEEFEETVTHVIDNTEGTGPKSYVYRWLNKLSRATLKNYGKRLIFQIDVAHPSHYHLSRMLQEKPTLTLPQDPRTLNIGGVTVSHPDKISRDNYLAIGDLYRVKLEAPPAEKVILSKGFTNKGAVRKTEEIEIPKGYWAVQGRWNGTTWDNNLIMTIASSAIGVHFWHGGNDFFRWIDYGIGANQCHFYNHNGAFITDKLAINFFGDDYSINFEIECQLSTDAYKAWQVKTFNAITEAYDNLKNEAEAKFGEFNPNNPGLNPEQKLALIRTELKKEALRKMFRCNPIGISDKYVVGTEYQSDCCTDTSNAEKVRFLETVFDWKNLTYEFFPYFYGSRDVVDAAGKKISDNWNEIQKFTDSDPHFEAFLQASYATIRIPVHRDNAKELAAINFIVNNSIANYEVVPAGAQSLLDELELEPVSLFTYDLDGNPLPLPKETIDLGIYNLPTDLVILECGTQNGVKPIGFPQDPTPPTSDVMIPKQYSPAIIADSCNP